MSSSVFDPVNPGRKDFIRIVLIAFLGSLLIFTWVILMNRYITDPEKIDSMTSVDFTIPLAQQKAPPPREEKEQKPVKRTETDLAPVPVLGSGMSSISLSLPNFNGAGTAGISESLLGELEDVVMTEDAVDTPPAAKNIKVPYPERAKQRQLEGRVLVSVHLSETGQVIDAQILESDPPGVFDSAVIEASGSWSFIPAKYQGKAVSSWVNVPIPFRLN